jgi:hypothetical protein
LRLVEITLGTLKPDKFDDFCLGRQFLGRLLLGPAQHEWLEPPGQERLGSGIAELLDWDAQGAAAARNLKNAGAALFELDHLSLEGKRFSASTL